MKQGWESKRLSELFQVQSSKRVHKSDWKSKGVPFYRAREIVKLARDGFVKNDLFISEELFSEFTEHKGAPLRDDIVISAVGTLGKCYLVKEDDRFYIKDASVLWLSKNSEVDSRYIVYGFESKLIQDQVFEGSMGATVGTLTISRAKNILFPIPPLPEQKRIVAKLDQAFIAIDQAQSNVERNLQNAKDLFQSKLNDIFSQNGEGWVEKKLGEVSEIIYGYTAKANHETGTAKYLRITDIQDKNVNWETVPFCDLDEPEFLRYCLIAGDIVFARTGATTGKSYLINNPPEAVFASYLIRVQINSKELDSAFLYLFFQSGYYWELINKGITGSAQGGFNASKLKELTVSYPESVKIQARYVEEMDDLVTQIQALQAGYQQQQKALQELKKSILQKAFNGEL